jgi:hypothetical protein
MRSSVPQSGSTAVSPRAFSRRTVLALFGVTLLAACASAGGRSGEQPSAGASTAAGAVTAFLNAAKSGDLDAMAAAWGTARGGVDVDGHSQADVERRLALLRCFLAHDRFELSRAALDSGSGAGFHVTLTRGDLTRSTTAVAVRGPDQRWYLQVIEIEPLQDICVAVVRGDSGIARSPRSVNH